jgi:hypothetical protein
MIGAAGIGHLLEVTGNNYNSLLAACSFAYLCALSVIHWLSLRLKPVESVSK